MTLSENTSHCNQTQSGIFFIRWVIFSFEHYIEQLATKRNLIYHYPSEFAKLQSIGNYFTALDKHFMRIIFSMYIIFTLTRNRKYIIFLSFSSTSKLTFSIKSLYVRTNVRFRLLLYFFNWFIYDMFKYP